MNQLFSKRREEFLTRCLKYTRYVFNDHFVLFLMVFIGFLSLQYSQFLSNLPTSYLSIYLVIALISLLLLPMGNIATYIEKADRQFLLVKEEEIAHYLVKQSQRSYLFWLLIQSALLLLFLPLFLAMGLGGWIFLLYVIVMGVLKYLFFQRKRNLLVRGMDLNWTLLLEKEEARKQSILRFFALFTTVKGISNSVKRRAYLDILLRWLPKNHQHTWQNLYLRSYLRNGELFALTIRLLILSLLSLLFVSQAWIASILVVLFNYLLVFQLIALYHAYDYQYLTQLFPIDQISKEKGVKAIIQLITFTVLAVEMLTAVFVLNEKVALVLLLVLSVFFNTLYLSFKVKRLVD